MSEIINLNYKWYFKENYNKDDLQLGNFKDFKEVDLPHSNKIVPINNFDEKMIQIVSIYKKMINIESLDDQYVLRFEGIGQKSKVYVNGKYVASHLCGFTRFDVDITSFLHVQENEIAVVVDSREINQPPFGFVIDYLCFGGIYREAYLLKRKKVHFIDSYFHHDENNWFFDYKISSKSKKYRINLSIKDEKDNEIFSSSCNNLSEIKGKMKKVHLWDVDDPYLHTLKANIVDENNIEIDSISYQVGFRFLSITPSGVLLNHKHIKVMGVNRHQSYPQVGYAMAKRGQYDDAIKIKELGFNAVRTSHYPQSIHFLDACDKLGLLVFEEIPGWQHVGDEKWKKIAINNVKDMIARDKNHPCIMLWGVRINESIDDHDFYVRTNQMAHECDPYRLTGGVRCIPHSELLEDVYTYNDFVNSGKNLYLKDKKEITSDMSKPYLVSEYGGHMFPTKAFDNENRRGELCLLHGNVVQEARRHDDIIATFAWCFADYNTHKEFGSGDLICYHGICDIFRNDKYSTYAYKKYKNEPYLEVTSNFNIGESNGGYIRDIVISTNCDFVKMYH
ncbi:MAG: glycoside hydrolase family 2 protein, partial [Erysipelotrichaceae bacterium]|nr:glycoside hydrolase family 2 protein [Erysipelotrichaceae bacterium]